MAWRDFIEKYLNTPGSCIRAGTKAAIERALANKETPATGEAAHDLRSQVATPQSGTPLPKK